MTNAILCSSSSRHDASAQPLTQLLALNLLANTYWANTIGKMQTGEKLDTFSEDLESWHHTDTLCQHSCKSNVVALITSDGEEAGERKATTATAALDRFRVGEWSSTQLNQA